MGMSALFGPRKLRQPILEFIRVYLFFIIIKLSYLLLSRSDFNIEDY